MYYEVNIKHDYLTEDNEVKSKVSKVIVNNVNLFAEAELKALEYGNSEWKADSLDNDPDVTAIKRSRIYEFVNKPQDGAKIYFATLDYTFTTDNGKEKHSKYLVGVYANEIGQAKAAMDNYIKQGLSDMKLTDLNETKFETVIEA